jgi:hypothetical protein
MIIHFYEHHNYVKLLKEAFFLTIVKEWLILTDAYVYNVDIFKLNQIQIMVLLPYEMNLLNI